VCMHVSLHACTNASTLTHMLASTPRSPLADPPPPCQRLWHDMMRLSLVLKPKIVSRCTLCCCCALCWNWRQSFVAWLCRRHLRKTTPLCCCEQSDEGNVSTVTGVRNPLTCGAVLDALHSGRDKEAKVTDIAANTKLPFETVSSCMRALSGKGFVRC